MAPKTREQKEKPDENIPRVNETLINNYLDCLNPLAKTPKGKT